jgi:hypothetical protein
MLPKGQGRPGRGCCGICFTPFGCALAGACGCHQPRGMHCRATGCTAGLFVHIATDHDRVLAEVRDALRNDYGIEAA